MSAPERMWRLSIAASPMYPEGGSFYHETKPEKSCNTVEYIRLDAPELLAMVDALKMCRNDLIGWLRVPNIDEDFNTDHSHHALQEADAAITAWEKLTK